MTTPSFKFVLALVAQVLALDAQAGSLTLSCPSASSTSFSERKHIAALAPGVVQRMVKHTLQVKAGGKTLKFVDAPPYDEPLDGVRYTFCDRREGFILLTHTDADRFGGKLIIEATGEVLPAGESVMFSPDRRAYFADVQPDGLDGMEWFIHGVDGRLSWKGYSFLKHPHKEGWMTATLADPQFDAKGQFSAQATCIQSDKISWKVTLVKQGGVWDWRPIRKCPDSD
ncbi:MAG: hypothetical protein ACLGI6_22985 [Gammaproteobacteria bacterium]